MPRRYFVTVIAPDRATLQRLRAYDLDLFQATAQATEKKQTRLAATRDPSGAEAYQKTAKVHDTREFTIDGLLTLDDIGRLVDNGYQILVQENDAKRSRAHTDVIEFREWLKGMEE